MARTSRAPAAPGCDRGRGGRRTRGPVLEPVEGAAGYQVLALAGDGRRLRAGRPRPMTRRFADTTVRNGAPVFYVVTALDAAGNASGRSPEAAALPHSRITTVEALGDARRATAALRSATARRRGPGHHRRGRLHRAASGIMVEVGLGPVGSEPDAATDAAWFVARQPVGTGPSGWVTFVPRTLGMFGLAARASADGGATWVVDTARTADRARHHPRRRAQRRRAAARGTGGAAARRRRRTTTSPSAGRTWTPRTCSATWCTGERPTPRSRRASRPPRTRSTRTRAWRPATLRLCVVALDTAFNVSPPSPPLDVSTPPNGSSRSRSRSPCRPDTPATDTLFIAGDFQGWAPGQTPMTQVDATTWTITLPFEDATSDPVQVHARLVGGRGEGRRLRRDRRTAR